MNETRKSSNNPFAKKLKLEQLTIRSSALWCQHSVAGFVLLSPSFRAESWPSLEGVSLLKGWNVPFLYMIICYDLDPFPTIFERTVGTVLSIYIYIYTSWRKCWALIISGNRKSYTCCREQNPITQEVAGIYGIYVYIYIYTVHPQFTIPVSWSRKFGAGRNPNRSTNPAEEPGLYPSSGDWCASNWGRLAVSVHLGRTSLVTNRNLQMFLRKHA